MSSDRLAYREGCTATRDAETLLRILADGDRMPRLSAIARNATGVAGAFIVHHPNGRVLGADGDAPSDELAGLATAHRAPFGILQMLKSNEGAERRPKEYAFVALLAAHGHDDSPGATLCLFDHTARTVPDGQRRAIERLSECISEGLALVMFGDVARNRFREVRKRERLLGAAIEGFADYPVVLLDKKGMIVIWSHAAEKLTGFTVDEVVGKPFTILHDESHAVLWLDEAKAHPVRIRAHCRRKNGPPIDAFVGIDPLYDANEEFCGFSYMTIRE